jgi:hypothetical protein
MSTTTSDPNQPTPEEEKPAPPAEEPKPDGEAPGQQEPAPQPPEQKAADKRFSRLTARMAAIQRERDELAFRLQQADQQRQGAQPQQQIDPQLQQAIEAEAERRLQARQTDEKMRAFHKIGGETFQNWPEICTDLQAMGAIPLGDVLIEMPNGHMVAAALHDEPDELERIAGIRTERGRAVALGKYAQALETRPAAVPISKAPRPIEPVTARHTPRFNAYTADMDALLKHFSRDGRPP